MTSSPLLRLISCEPAPLPAEAALLLPWYVTGMLALPEAQLVAAAEELANELAVARLVQAEVAAMGEARGRPSARPLQALFASIDADVSARLPSTVPSNVTPLVHPAARAVSAVGPAPKKIGRRR